MSAESSIAEKCCAQQTTLCGRGSSGSPHRALISSSFLFRGTPNSRRTTATFRHGRAFVAPGFFWTVAAKCNGVLYWGTSQCAVKVRAALSIRQRSSRYQLIGAAVSFRHPQAHLRVQLKR
jgi:hypothetical protein